MDKETLSNYGWVVICIIVLVIMIALATPFGNYIRDAVKVSTEAFGTKAAGAFNDAGMTVTAPTWTPAAA